MNRLLLLLFITLLFLQLRGFSQDIHNNSEIHGDFHTDIQYYNKDSEIGTTDVPEKLLMNSYTNILYRYVGFSAGIRYESYLNPLLGYDPRYKGSGIPYRFLSYSNKNLTISAGNFYEQFGRGLIFRSYENKDLGYDNAMDGLSIRFEPVKGITLKGIIGQQRYYFAKGEGIVRGMDAEVNLNDLISRFSENKMQISLGGSIVSKYNKDKNPAFKLPENVAGFAGRMNLYYVKSKHFVHFDAEYVYKINDPYPAGEKEYYYIYKPAEALLLTGSYNRKGLGIMVQAKRLDNMNFRSDITATGNALMINYLPASTLQHQYMLQNYFPYSTQANGEMGLQSQINYKIKKDTWLGGKYGVELMLNYARVQSIDKKLYPDSTHLGYTSDFFRIGKEVYFEDISAELNKKIDSKTKITLAFSNILYNDFVIKGFDYHGKIYSNIGIADLTYKLTDSKALRFEIQHMFTRQYKKNWASALLEYSVSPKWTAVIFDQYNYGNDIAEKRLHYYNGGFSYAKGGSSLQLLYGRRVEGVMCIGGVCRYVPAANGLSIVLNVTF